ncbi:hypothetical protein WJX72_005024 [[Myrmecia] bisecta]|uniref:BRCT domain-containing protein n=1 Tax=[Myrmecia] bisecta TaxID=41462 RepID=A0AAW1QQG7_9CHLO
MPANLTAVWHGSPPYQTPPSRLQSPQSGGRASRTPGSTGHSSQSPTVLSICGGLTIICSSEPQYCSLTGPEAECSELQQSLVDALEAGLAQGGMYQQVTAGDLKIICAARDCLFKDLGPQVGGRWLRAILRARKDHELQQFDIDDEDPSQEAAAYGPPQDLQVDDTDALACLCTHEEAKQQRRATRKVQHRLRQAAEGAMGPKLRPELRTSQNRDSRLGRQVRLPAQFSQGGSALPAPRLPHSNLRAAGQSKLGAGPVPATAGGEAAAGNAQADSNGDHEADEDAIEDGPFSDDDANDNRKRSLEGAEDQAGAERAPKRRASPGRALLPGTSEPSKRASPKKAKPKSGPLTLTLARHGPNAKDAYSFPDSQSDAGLPPQPPPKRSPAKARAALASPNHQVPAAKATSPLTRQWKQKQLAAQAAAAAMDSQTSKLPQWDRRVQRARKPKARPPARFREAEAKEEPDAEPAAAAGSRKARGSKRPRAAEADPDAADQHGAGQPVRMARKMGCSKCRYARLGCKKCREDAAAPAGAGQEAGLSTTQRRASLGSSGPATAGRGGIFGGLTFLLTGGGGEPGSVEAKRSLEAKKRLTKVIIQHGGQVAEGIPKLQDTRRLSMGCSQPSGIDAVVSDRKVRTFKYLYGLVAGRPVVKAEWITACATSGRRAPPSAEQLWHAGRDAGLRIFEGIRVYVYGDAGFVEGFGQIVQHAGGILMSGLEAAAGPRLTEPACDLAIHYTPPDGQPPPPPARELEALKRSARRLQVPVRDSNWLIAALEAGELPGDFALLGAEPVQPPAGRGGEDALPSQEEPLTCPSQERPPAGLGLQESQHRTYYGAFVKGSLEIGLGDDIEVQAPPGEDLTRIMQIEALWAETPVDGRQRMLARCRRYYRPQETYFKGDANELFHSHDVDNRVSLAAVITKCRVEVTPPTPLSARHLNASQHYSCMYHYDHISGKLEPISDT